MKKLLLFISLFSLSANAQSGFNQFVSYVNSLPDSSGTAAAVDSFLTYAKSVGIPFIEENKAVFIYVGKCSSVSVAGDFNSWDPGSDIMQNLERTDFWYFTGTFESNARLDYKLVKNGNEWILDPENPNTSTGGFGTNSELVMPGYVRPWETEFNPDIHHGKIETLNLKSADTDLEYRIKIYLPPGYSADPDGYPSVYFQDGFEYIDLAGAVNAIDNLIDSGRIRKVISVFVKPENRNEEYAFSLRNRYISFFVNELVPFIDSAYNTVNKSSERLVLGCSYGANISALISYHNPGIFGNCGLHSAALQPNEYESFNLIAGGLKKDIRFVSIWGSYESLRDNMRTFRDSLLNKGYSLKWIELPEGHSWRLWGSTIDEMLEYFFPAYKTGMKNLKETLPEGFNLNKNYYENSLHLINRF